MSRTLTGHGDVVAVHEPAVEALLDDVADLVHWRPAALAHPRPELAGSDGPEAGRSRRRDRRPLRRAPRP